MKGRFGDFLLWVDYKVDGMRWRLIVAAAVLQVFLAPMWDRYLPTGRAVAARLEPATFLATLLFIALFSAIVLGRLAALSAKDDEEGAEPSRWVKVKRFAAAAVRAGKGYWGLLKQEPLIEITARIGAMFCVAMMALRGAIALLRWGLWQVLNGLEAALPSLAAIWTPAFQGLEQVYFAEQRLVRLVMLVSLPITAAVAWVILRGSGSSTADARRVRLLAPLAPLVALRDPASPRALSAALTGAAGETATKLLSDLANWQPDPSVDDENGCRDDIAFYLRGRGYGVATERWISSPKDGRRRVDLVVDDEVAMELKYEIHQKGAAERDRVIGQIETYANIWGTNGPVLLFLAGTPRMNAQRFGEPAERWNADLSKGGAPIVVVADS